MGVRLARLSLRAEEKDSGECAAGDTSFLKGHEDTAV
jgi:hypothetical protein